MRLVRIALPAALLVALLTSTLRADIITLKDGTKLEGSVKRAGNTWQITTPDGKVVEVPIDKVKSVELTPASGPSGKPTESRAVSNLQSLRRSVENVGDIQQIIDRFKQFVEQNKGTKAAEEAQKDLDVWIQRQDQGLVKLGSRWVSPAERSQFADKALAVTTQARELIAHGRVHDGDLLITQALDFDPQCPPALYLRGVVQFQQHQLVNARKSFEAVTLQITDHAPTLNNVAIILWQQNAIMPALVRYESAMIAAPVNKVILDNVAEAWARVPEEQRRNNVAQRVVRQFIEQDTRLQEQMAAQGLYRWGAVWVDRPTMEQYRKVEKETNDKITTLKSEISAAENAARTIDQQIDTIEQSLVQMRNDSVRRDPDGKIVRYPLPPSYYDLQNQEAKLRSDRQQLASKAGAAQSQIKSLQAQLPAPKFTGIQKLIGAEGTPMMLPPEQRAPPEPAAPEPTTPPPNDVPPLPTWPAPSTLPSTLPGTLPGTQPSTQPDSR